MPNQFTIDDIQATLSLLQGRIEHPSAGDDQTLVLAVTACAQSLAAIVERLDSVNDNLVALRGADRTGDLVASIRDFTSTYETYKVMEM